MAEDTITFQLIRKIQLEEQKVNTLTRLPANFFQAVSNYMDQKKKLIASDDRKNALEIKNIERLVEDIFDRRERKILNAAIITARSGLPPENLDEDETPFYDSIVNLVKNRRGDTLKLLFTKSEETMSTLVFKEDTPAFLGIDEKTYGPFKKGDRAVLPEENMKILLERSVLEELK